MRWLTRSCHHEGLRLRWDHMQDNVLRGLCLVLVLLMQWLLLMQNGLIKCTTSLLLVKVALLHIQSDLLSACAHHIHELVVHIHVNHLGIISVVMIVSFKVSLIDVVGHAPFACGKLCSLVPMLQNGVPYTGLDRFGNPFFVCSLSQRICKPSLLGADLGNLPCILPAVNFMCVRKVLKHCCNGLPLIVQLLPYDLHIRHLRTVGCSCGLPYAKVLHLSSVPSLLAFIERILAPTELRYFRCAP